jgi:hypothetical protein
VPAIVGCVLLAGSDMRRPWFSALPRRPNYVNEIQMLIRDSN